MLKHARRIFSAVLLCALYTPVFAASAPSKKPPMVKPQGTVIASAHALATDAGFEVIAKGGNAFDAAVAVSAALSVVEPVSSGLGGGGFFLLHDAKTGKDYFIDARETSPASATPEKFLDAKGNLDTGKSQDGPWSAGIPGLPAALVYVSQKYGKLPLKTSLAPAIRLARNGFPMYARLANALQERRDVIGRFPGSRAIFMPGGKPLTTGDLLIQSDLADTLQLIADKGFDGFYKGRVARQILDAVKQEGGHWTAEELSSYRVKEREPIRFNYRGWQLVTAPPPSSGGIALAEILQLLEPWDIKAMSAAKRTHLVVESMRRAYHDRTFYLGDPDFVQVPQKTLLSPDYADGLRTTINPSKATPSLLFPNEPTPFEHEETTHFSIIDAQGNKVGVTQTVNLEYGSGLIPPGTGVLLNDEMDDFALKAGTPNAFGVIGYAANAPKPGKRMLSSMSPTFMSRPGQEVVIGTPGGSRIITMVLLGILGYDAGLTPQQVAALPRYHHQWLPDEISIEKNALDAETIKALEAMGHVVKPRSSTWGNMQTVDWNTRTGEVRGGTDPRNPVGKTAVHGASSP